MPRRALLLLTALSGAVALTGCATDRPSRQDEVAARGKKVMPFDLDKTTHRFIPKTDGLLEEVIADDTKDTTQIRLVRQHLQKEAKRFAHGDFGDPQRIHGKDMPGLADLKDSAGKIDITYRQIGGGATIRFRTRDQKLITALHEWGEAQVSDHGVHAEPT